jgi:hypothetical protein
MAKKTKEPKGQKHHYIPCFYLKQWICGKGVLCEFSRPYKTVEPRRTSPDGTGYIRGLNTVQGLGPDEADYLENVFFKIADDAAARAVQILLTPPPWNMTVDDKSGWTRFIMSLIHRHPESVEKHRLVAEAAFRENLPEVEADYAAHKKEGDPPTYAEWCTIHSPNPAGRLMVRLLQRVIDSEVTGRGINSMRWTVLHQPYPKHLLLTSDRPVIMTNGLDKPNSQLFIPISPHHVFVATNTLETENYVRSVWNNKQMLPQVNDRVASQSRKYVWGFSDAQLSFVTPRLGRAWTADPVENLTIEQMLQYARDFKAKQQK